jgi:hypothetical protein
MINERCFTFKTKDLLAHPIKIRGEKTYDSLIKVLTQTEGEAVYKYRQYIEEGRKLGEYK